ncbi:3071_t:CDS:2, partial [Gigaspora rosea]
QLEQENPNLTQKQVHAWWTYFLKKEYIRDDDQLNSTKILVEENECKEIVTDATYKTNALGYELYSVIGHYDGSGFALAYLFIEGSKKNDAAVKTWSNIKIQLCYWHLKKALKKRLADNTYPKIINYSSSSAHQTFDFINIEFYPTPPLQLTSAQKKSFCFCPKELHPKIIDMIEIHIHLYPLIPNANGFYLSASEIWKQSTKQIYELCVNHDLRLLWTYL